ncbi:MAG: ABC transporter permease [Chloroflexi bacterium]|nr:ABC transporter permease [Chloroflexota bacterium]
MNTSSTTSTPSEPGVLLLRPVDVDNPWKDALRRLMRNRAALLSAIFLLALILVSLFAEVVSPYDPTFADFTSIRTPPSAEHLLGTDEVGRDLLTRIIYGARISLFVGIIVQTISTFVGILLGLVAGYYGGLVDTIIMRAVDIMYSLPNFLFAVFMVSLLTPDIGSVILTLTIAGWPFSARLMRGQTLLARSTDYVLAAEAVGAGRWRIMLTHILPNSLSPIIVQFTLGVATVIMAEAGLSFLGIGIRPPNPTWGGMINKGREFIRSSAHLAIYPSIVLGLTMIAFNFLGDGLRDALDPRMKK